MLGKCVRRCWDSQTTMRYYIGTIADLPEDHVFFKMANPCFVPLTPDDLQKSADSPDAKVTQMAKMLQKQGEEIAKLREGPIRTDELIPESAQTEKRGPGNPNWKKKD